MEISLKTLEQKLQTALAPHFLEIINESQDHAGHSGAIGDHSHLLVRIQATCFEGKSKVACHQMIYRALATELQHAIHALRIEIL